MVNWIFVGKCLIAFGAIFLFISVLIVYSLIVSGKKEEEVWERAWMRERLNSYVGKSNRH